jgi:PEGA domain
MTNMGSVRMRIVFGSFLIGLLSLVASGQSSEHEAPACKKTITFAIAEGGQPVPAIPRVAAKWLGKAKHIRDYPGLCFSQVPSSNTINYIVIFSDSEPSFDGLKPSAQTYTSAGPISNDPAAVSSYGGTWSYSYVGKLPGSNTSSVDLQRVDTATKNLVIRAYNQEGHEVAHYGAARSLTDETLLRNVIADIERDRTETPPKKKVTAPLSIYYVNCDVDSTTPVSPAPTSASSNAGTEEGSTRIQSATVTASTPKPHPSLEFVSNPTGAEIYLDGRYIGKTPLITSVDPGMHTLVIRKEDFTTWQRRIEVSSVGHKVSAYLERKFLLLK